MIGNTTTAEAYAVIVSTLSRARSRRRTHVQYEFESPNIILIRRQAFPAALSAALNFGDSIPSLPRTAEACMAANACCSYRRFNS
jgi:hypothetical protein